MEAFTTFAEELADRAGEVLTRYFRAPLDVVSKSDASPVTIADQEAEEAMCALIRQTYPDHGIFGEESGRSNIDATYQWVLDPIDGTRAFIAGIPTFTTLIALCKDGAPILGLINQPISGERWINGTLNGKKITTRKNSTLKNAAIGTTSLPYYFSSDEAARFERVRQASAHIVIGGDGYGYAMVANGQLDAFIDTCLKPYDFCALVPVIEGAGGVITDWQGKPLTIHSKGDVLACANKELHTQALRILND